MVSNITKENNLRESMLGRMRLTAENERIARQYLDMDSEENPALLEQLQHQDLSSSFPMNGYAEYLKWLHKNKRTEALTRYVRFVVEVGGSTAWRILVNDNYEAKLADLESMLTYLTGAHAEEQKTAIRAELCAKSLYKDGKAEDAKILCQSGKENPDIFRCALDYCYILDKEKSQNTQRTRALLTAMYLHYQEAGTEPDLTKMLLKDLFAEIPNITAPGKAFSGSEIQCLQNYARTAKKDTPFPQSVLSICRARQGWMNVAFVAGCAFLALRQSVHFEILFRLTLGEGFAYKNRIRALDIARGIVEDDDFHATMDEIEEMLPILDEDYIIWCLYGYPSDAEQGENLLMECKHAECEAEVRRMAVKCPDGIRAAVQKADSEEYKKLTELVQSANPALYEEIHASYQDVFREKLAMELVQWHFKGCEETAKQYLMGKCSLDILLPGLEQSGRSNACYLWPGNYERINHLKALEEFSFYRRAVILELLKGVPDFFQMYSVSMAKLEKSKDKSILYGKEQVAGIFQIFMEENVPVGLQLKALGSVCDNVSEKQDKILLLETCVEAAVERQQEQDQEQWEQGLMEALRQGGTSARCICLKVLERSQTLDNYKELLFEIVESSADQVQKQLLALFRQHTEWDADVLAMLASKKQKARGFAVMVLEEWVQPSHLEEVRAALAKEKNKKLSMQLQALAETLEEAGTEGNHQRPYRRAEEQLAAEIYKGNRKRKVEWVQDVALPAVHFQDMILSDGDTSKEQEAASPEYMLAILASYADMEIPGVNPDAQKLAALLVPQECAACMRALYHGWMAAGAEAKKRWVLYAAALHGDAELITELHRQIKDWADHSRGAIAAETVRALALNGSSQALLLVDQMARKFKSNQVKNAAKKALSEAAAALGISREELEDRIVPDFGFNAQMERVFDYGTRTFTVRLNPSLEIEVYDESGKKLKSMPKPGKQDDADKANQAQDEFRQLKKQLKLVVAGQKLRLEQALSAARFWEAQKWRALFVLNPVMHQFAVGLIWGTYEEGLLKDTFRYMEDGSFNTVEEEEYTLPESGVIGLVHPLELSEDIIAAWKEQLSDYEIAQPVEQLERPVYRITEEEQGAQKLTRFYGRELNGLSLSGKLLTQGWVRGEIMDAGFFDNYCRSDSVFGAKLMFSGCSVGYENEDVTIDDLYFYQTIGGTSGKTEPCRPDEVSARYFSETVLQIARTVGEA
ncbi:MAG: DUF4132 domain-containing protein [Lachnospiraceae bacterium]|nr:DUF4132 domain-containing protein [Lachnospiraceae bacterium]